MIEVLKQALEALEFMDSHYISLPQKCMDANISLRQAIANLEQEKEIHDRHCNQGEWKGVCKYSDPNCPTIAKLESQEPEAWFVDFGDGDDASYCVVGGQEPKEPRARARPLFFHPPQRTWVGLTDEEIRERWFAAEPTPDGRPASYNYARAIEAKLKQKNGFAED